MLNIACAAKARTRNVTLARPNRDEVLNFSILGGFERGFGIFISKVDKRSKAEDVGLKRGDQILEVNGQSFEHVNHAKALDILRASTHLSITVKSNLLGRFNLQTRNNNKIFLLYLQLFVLQLLKKCFKCQTILRDLEAE